MTQVVAIASALTPYSVQTCLFELNQLAAGAKFTWTHLVKARANQSVTIPGLGPMGPQGGGRSPSDAGDEVRSFQLSVHRRHRPLVPQYIGAVAQQADKLTQEGRELKVGCSTLCGVRYQGELRAQGGLLMAAAPARSLLRP